FAAESSVTITGTAADSGGVVGAVEVSVNGGTTWHRAVGLDNWSFTWRPGVLGAVNILSRAVDDSGNIEAPKTPTAIPITAGNCPCTIWAASAVPWHVDVNDPSAIEVGLKFRSDIDGYINGIRFYKAATNTGVHVGNLWTSSGALLASATFSSETASGWQQVMFGTAVRITANTTYVASYHTNVGHYS